MQVTISLLPVSLSLVHIPRSRLPHLASHVLRQILHPSPAFLNITCNDLELSIFAEEHLLRHFHPVASRDRRKRRAQPIEISYEKWSVLQIDSHSDQVDNSGARVRDLSAPLAEAGISILYQSSYMSDFIFVKESRLQQALAIFAAHGFDLYSADTPTPAVLTRSTSPTTPDAPASPRSKSHSPSSSEVRILSPDLACVGLSDEFGVDHWGLKIVKLVAFPDLIPTSASFSQNSSQTDCSDPLSPLSSPSDSSSEDDGYFSHSPKHTSSFSPTLSRSHSYSDLVSPVSPSRSASKHPYLSPFSLPYPTKAQHPVHQQFFSFTRTPEGSSLTADVCVLATLFPPHERHMVICGGELDAADERLAGSRHGPEDSDGEEDEDQPEGSLKCLQIDLTRFGLDKHGLVNRFSRVLEQNGINHMYSSTFKSANLLVDKKHALRAQSLLRSC